MPSHLRWFAVVAMVLISTTELAAKTPSKAIGEACGFRILSSAVRFRDLVKGNDDRAATKLFLDNQSVGLARILAKGGLISLEDRSDGMACVKRAGEPFCYWMSTKDFEALVGGGK
ncbi:hypothetical protein ABIF63_005173 [Bradyrhizobium japonicum]|uniref:Uncharacterized protein n=1 Tax=Bradyrhizobium japonicum TaxID=375 RepID=A0ABV2RVV7_BRAJP|nr:hypothetical protein [Bradyrhizobium japonicum]UQD95742.1 hypothetical protein JEY30_29695 [Bradyrhizobium japonicum]WLB15794.1 hypothetical protein QIH95_27525 [Bradyrhizobium japonicum]